MTLDLTGRTALVTGSSRGIGRAIACGLAEAGATVIVHGSRAGAALEEAVAEVERRSAARAVIADLADPRALPLPVTDPVDILVLNASIQFGRPWTEVTDEDLELQWRVNFSASHKLIQQFAPGMVARGWGRILTLGSVNQLRPRPHLTVYAATKAAQANLVRNLARELAPAGVTINNLAPGVIDTERNAAALARAETVRELCQRIPVGRIGQPADCVPLAVLLCSAAGSYITGADIPVDGGLSLPA